MSDASAAGSAANLTDVAVICGPTAAGKSAIALWLAQRLRGTIVSADSRQIYRGFDIGTAKPSPAERASIPHAGLDVIGPEERYSAARWSDAASEWMRDAQASGRTPIVVGGTGLYLRALFEGLFQEPPLDQRRRAELGDQLGTFDTPELRRWVAALDRERSHLGRTQLLRATEIALLTGHRLSDLHRDHARASSWRPHYLLVDPGAALGERIAARIDIMFEQGWAGEVRGLMDVVAPDAPAWNATGYGAVRRLVSGAASLPDVHEEILIATRQFAKRQRTWFRHQLPVERVTRVDPAAANWPATVEQWYAGIPNDGEMNA